MRFFSGGLLPRFRLRDFTGDRLLNGLRHIVRRRHRLCGRAAVLRLDGVLRICVQLRAGVHRCAVLVRVSHLRALLRFQHTRQRRQVGSRIDAVAVDVRSADILQIVNARHEACQRRVIDPVALADRA